MDRPELYGIIDSVARTHPPGGLRLTPIELVEWLQLVAANPKADRGIKRDAGRAAKHVHKLITGTYEMPNFPPPPDSFDEHTPPPRTRPQGPAVPRVVKLPPGEDVVAVFRQWDREGRVPAGSLLCELVGKRPSGEGEKSGYRLLAGGPSSRTDCEVADEDLEGYRVAVELRRGRDPQWYVVFAPEKPARAAAKGGA